VLWAVIGICPLPVTNYSAVAIAEGPGGPDGMTGCRGGPGDRGDQAPLSVLWSTLASMSTYNGEALIIGEDNTEIRVSANLRRSHGGLLTGWGGTVTAAPDVLGEMANLDEGRLRFPDGKEAEFLRPDRSDWALTGRMTIIGQDEAPF